MKTEIDCPDPQSEGSLSGKARYRTFSLDTAPYDHYHNNIWSREVKINLRKEGSPCIDSIMHLSA